jgi:hypothetical protein
VVVQLRGDSPDQLKRAQRQQLAGATSNQPQASWRHSSVRSRATTSATEASWAHPWERSATLLA